MVTWLSCFFFHTLVVPIKTYESMPLVHTLRINKLEEANLAAHPETLTW